MHPVITCPWSSLDILGTVGVLLIVLDVVRFLRAPIPPRPWSPRTERGTWRGWWTESLSYMEGTPRWRFALLAPRAFARIAFYTVRDWWTR